MAADHALHAKFSRLTQQEEAKGLFEEPSRIGTRLGWGERLRERGVTTPSRRERASRHHRRAFKFPRIEIRNGPREKFRTVR